jgi:hypothetical protein
MTQPPFAGRTEPLGFLWATVYAPGPAGGSLAAIHADADQADEYARRVRGLIIALPIVADHRNPIPGGN